MNNSLFARALFRVRSWICRAVAIIRTLWWRLLGLRVGASTLIASGCYVIDHDHQSARRDMPIGPKAMGRKRRLRSRMTSGSARTSCS